MRKLKVLSIICLALLAMVGCRKKEINKLKDEINDLKTRVTVLEGLCKQNNTNINSLQTIVNTSVTQGDYITSVTPITENGKNIGYTITFANQGPITIYNGTDGYSPVVGIAKFSDGSYYWTLNGEWLLDDEGQKIHVTGENGTNGITPQLKVEGDNWYVSYDDGENWTFVSKAIDGEINSIFEDIAFDDNFVYFTLKDGTQLQIQNTRNVFIENGAIKAEFSVSATKKVYFSQGNLQYQASANLWRFAEHQYEMIGESNANISSIYNGWIDLFGWGTSGYNDRYPYMTSEINDDYWNRDSNIAGTNYDWGVYNAISNGGDQSGLWRVLTKEEWEYLLYARSNALNKCGVATVNNVNGIILLPDDWSNTVLFTKGVAKSNGSEYFKTVNNYSALEWEKMEKSGAVFLPAAGHRNRNQ